MRNRSYLYSAILAAGGLAWACTDHTIPSGPSSIVLQNRSVTPTLVKTQPGFEGVQIYSLISSDDVLPNTPKFRLGGSADGSGLLKNPDGTFTLVVNHEDNFSVARVILDPTFKPTGGEYLLNSDGGQWRLCSATLATPAEHGFGPVYLTCGESSEESQINVIDPNAPASGASVVRANPALGRQNSEQALPLPKTAFAGKTVIVIGDDDSGTNGGQVFLYVANTVGDLDNGTFYVMRRKDLNQKEMDVKAGQSYEVEFVKVAPDGVALASMTGAQQNNRVDQVLKAVKFGRVEDVDYRKDGVGRDIYFNVTGQNNTGVNADYSRSKYGRVYKVVLDANDPLKGQLELVLDGDDRNGIAKQFQDVDNICVTKNFLYTAEDPNGYGDESHDSYVYQYNLTTKELKPMLVLDHHRGQPDQNKFNKASDGVTNQLSKFGDWEYGSMVDISEQTGIADTFMLMLQPHTWRDNSLKGIDGGTKRLDENQASQIVILKGVAR